MATASKLAYRFFRAKSLFFVHSLNSSIVSLSASKSFPTFRIPAKQNNDRTFSNK